MQAASAITYMYQTLRERGLRMSTRAWRRNMRQRAALGMLRFPNSSLTEASLSQRPARDLSLLEQKELEILAQPQACRGPDHLRQAMTILKSRGGKAAIEYVRQCAVNYPVRPQAWFLLSQFQTHRKRSYAEARKAIRAALEALGIADLQVSALQGRGIDVANMQQWLGIFRIKVHPPLLDASSV
jgi:hypothetical protein